jgi:hypothetical protein
MRPVGGRRGGPRGADPTGTRAPTCQGTPLGGSAPVLATCKSIGVRSTTAEYDAVIRRAATLDKCGMRTPSCSIEGNDLRRLSTSAYDRTSAVPSTAISADESAASSAKWRKNSDVMAVPQMLLQGSICYGVQRASEIRHTPGPSYNHARFRATRLDPHQKSAPVGGAGRVAMLSPGQKPTYLKHTAYFPYSQLTDVKPR